MDQDTPHKTSITQQQFSSWASVYDSMLFRIYFSHIYKKILSIFLNEQRSYFHKGTKFLDVACGTAEMISRLAKTFPEVEFTGSDFAQGMILKSRGKTKGLKNIQIIEADVTNLAFPDKSFDIVLCSEAFHHFWKPQKALSEIYRVAKPGALFVVVDAAFDSILQKIIFGFGAKLIEEYHRIYRREELKILLEQSGFSIKSTFTFLLNNFFVSKKTK